MEHGRHDLRTVLDDEAFEGRAPLDRGHVGPCRCLVSGASPACRGDDAMSPAIPWDDTTWAAWAVGLVEPLIDPYDRVADLEAMQAQAQGHRLRAVTLLAGTLTDLLDSLPDGDPWRHVDASTFGTYRDGLDLVPTEATEIREDIGLAALARPLGRDGARLMSDAEHGWENVAHRANELAEPVPALARAVAWASWRRRVYVGEDTYPVLVAFSWLRRAALVASGLQIDDAESHERTRASAKIVDDLV